MKRGIPFIIFGVFIMCFMFWNFTEDKIGLLCGSIIGSAFLISGSILNISANLIEDIKLEKLNILHSIGDLFELFAKSLEKLNDEDENDAELSDTEQKDTNL